jgi:hypothetical protein
LSLLILVVFVLLTLLYRCADLCYNVVGDAFVTVVVVVVNVVLVAAMFILLVVVAV